MSHIHNSEFFQLVILNKSCILSKKRGNFKTPEKFDRNKSFQAFLKTFEIASFEKIFHFRTHYRLNQPAKHTKNRHFSLRIIP